MNLRQTNNSASLAIDDQFTECFTRTECKCLAHFVCFGAFCRSVYQSALPLLLKLDEYDSCHYMMVKIALF